MISVWIEKQRAKAILLQVFKSGNIGATYTYGKTNGTIYPKIRNVHFDHKKKAVLYTFSLPVGMDPNEIKKKEYCLQQVFGENIEIEGEYREFKLIVSLKPFFIE
jgi:S-DNA-T family DNA segregation ATPase FtsK/SpoIIIE